jgi:hypothetical protein
VVKVQPEHDGQDSGGVDTVRADALLVLAKLAQARGDRRSANDHCRAARSIYQEANLHLNVRDCTAVENAIGR